MNGFRALVSVALGLLLMAADCGPSDDEAQPTPDPCALVGTCRPAGGGTSPGGGGDNGAIEIVDDGLGGSAARAAFRGVYLSDLDDVLASARETDTLLLWLQENGFNSISCYDLNTIFDSPQATADLATFIALARSEAGVRHVGAVGSTASDFGVATQTYNAHRTNPAERFDVLTLENEWWNGASTFADTITRMQTMTSVAHAQHPPLVADAYIGWFDNPGDADHDGHPDFTAAEMAAAIVGNTDRVLIHDYRPSPDFAYMESRLRLLSNAAVAAGRTFDVVVIFSAESAADGNDFMGRYFQTHTFDDAWAELRGQIDRASPASTAHLNFIGYQVFASQHAMRARPL